MGPLFKWFGSKWSSSKLMPPPTYDVIREPFAGSAGYSIRHHAHKVMLWEVNTNVAALWTWLIGEATPSDIREIPISVPEGTDIRTLGLSRGQALLMKHWQRTNNVGDCWTVSPWGNKPGQWTVNTRARVAEEVALVKHWVFMGADGMTAFDDTACTWFVDPNYQFNYNYQQPRHDYDALGTTVRSLHGQVIVCEAGRDGNVPQWLPFVSLGRRVTSRRTKGHHHHSDELFWCNQ